MRPISAFRPPNKEGRKIMWFTDGKKNQGTPDGRAAAADFHALQIVRGYWEAMRREGGLPRRDDINPRGMAVALEQVFLVEQIAPNHGRFRLAGMALNDLLGMDVRGMPITALLEPVARSRLSEALGGLFRGEHLLDLWLEAERGIGRPPLMARILLLPVIGAQGEPDMALGCLCSKGEIGRAPRRFAISRLMREPLPTSATQDIAQAFAEPPQSFRAPSGRPNLRLVSSK